MKGEQQDAACDSGEEENNTQQDSNGWSFNRPPDASGGSLAEGSRVSDTSSSSNHQSGTPNDDVQTAMRMVEEDLYIKASIESGTQPSESLPGAHPSIPVADANIQRQLDHLDELTREKLAMQRSEAENVVKEQQSSGVGTKKNGKVLQKPRGGESLPGAYAQGPGSPAAANPIAQLERAIEQKRNGDVKSSSELQRQAKLQNAAKTEQGQSGEPSSGNNNTRKIYTPATAPVRGSMHHSYQTTEPSNDSQASIIDQSVAPSSGNNTGEKIYTPATSTVRASMHHSYQFTEPNNDMIQEPVSSCATNAAANRARRPRPRGLANNNGSRRGAGLRSTRSFDDSVPGPATGNPRINSLRRVGSNVDSTMTRSRRGLSHNNSGRLRGIGGAADAECDSSEMGLGAASVCSSVSDASPSKANAPKLQFWDNKTANHSRSGSIKSAHQEQRDESSGAGVAAMPGIAQNHPKFMEHATSGPLNAALCAVANTNSTPSGQAPGTSEPVVSHDAQLAMQGAHAVAGPALHSADNSPDVSVYEGDELDDVEPDIEVGARVEEQFPRPGSSHFSGDSDNFLVEAELVPERAARSHSFLWSNPSSNGLVVEAKPIRTLLANKLVWLAIFCLVVIIVVLAVGLGVGLQEEGDNDKAPEASPGPLWSSMSPTTAPIPTLQQVRETGVLRCGIEGSLQSLMDLVVKLYPTLAMVDSSNATTAPLVSGRQSFDTQLCQAIASAIGDGVRIERVHAWESNKFQLLANGTADILLTKVFLNMENDVYVPSIGQGTAYTAPFYASGFGFAGLPEYVQCAEDELNTIGNCSGIRICAPSVSSFLQTLHSRVPDRQLVIVDEARDSLLGFVAGACNVVAAESYAVLEPIMRELGYKGDFATGTKEITREVYCFATLDSDLQWRDFVNAVLLGLTAAQEHGVTRETANLMGTTNLFGEQYGNMFINSVRAVGSVGDAYDRALGWILPRTSRNYLNDGTTGLLYSSPLGSTLQEGPGPVSGGTLSSILGGGDTTYMGRPKLRCGVRGGRRWFASFQSQTGMWHGLDVDYCTAVASSMSMDTSFVNLTTPSEGFQLLQQGSIDLYAGATWTLQNEVLEPSTMQGFSFTKPYFYGPLGATQNSSSFDDNLCLATRKDDAQWSSYIFWVADSLLLAEEMGVSQRTSSDMPVVKLFGPELTRMFRDTIHAVGSYEEVYERNLGSQLPRGGRNLLNRMEDMTPLLYVPPGFFS